MPDGAWLGAAACHFCRLCTLFVQRSEKKNCQKLNLEKRAFDVIGCAFCREDWRHVWCEEAVYCLHWILYGDAHVLLLLASQLSTSCLVGLLSAERCTFESKHTLGFSQTEADAKLVAYFQCQEAAEVLIHIYSWQ